MTSETMRGICILLCVASKILSYVEMIMTHLLKTKSDRRKISSAPHHCVPPPEGCVCVNVDMTLFPSKNRMGWGVVVEIIRENSCSRAAKDWRACRLLRLQNW
jgi:hypothetical protein